MDMVSRFLLLASGKGMQIASGFGGIPKPLVPLCGVPLLKHVMMSSQQAGINNFVIVAGYRANLIRRWLNTRSFPGISVTLIENLEYHKANGVSALSARQQFDNPFLFLMADHIF